MNRKYPPGAECSRSGCNGRPVARGFCRKCYQREWQIGNYFKLKKYYQDYAKL